MLKFSYQPAKDCGSSPQWHAHIVHALSFVLRRHTLTICKAFVKNTPRGRISAALCLIRKRVRLREIINRTGTGMLSEEWIHELLSKTNIVDVVGGYVTLQNKSGRLWACCPFHNEKTPSFTVNADRGFYHCFGCGKSGNAIHFVMEQEKMTFPEACTYLAEKVNLPVPQHTDNAQYEKRKAARNKIYEMNKKAARAFYANLYGSAGAAALSYLRGRGMTDGVIKAFGMGFAPDRWDALTGMLEQEGYTKQDMLEAGLAKSNDGRFYDLFRNRIIIPIINPFSEVIGFGGRVMDDSLPKYLNSPETAAFSKSRNLYNLNMVRKQKNLQYLILVEGYMDVIALSAHGIPQCVATLGTALTTEQARLLKRYAQTVYLSYDGDEAGKKATLRAADLLEKENLTCRVISVPGGEDPDEYLKRHGKDGFLGLLKTARPVLDYKFDVAEERYDLSDGYQKEQFVKEAIGILKEVQSAVVKEKYVKDLSGRTGFSEHSIMQDLGMPARERTPVRQQKQPEKRKKPAAERAENYIVALLCANPDRALSIEKYILPEELLRPANEKAYSYILQCAKKGFMPQGDEILSVFQNEEDIAHITRLLESDVNVFGEGMQSDSFLSDCIKRVKIRNLEMEKEEWVAKSKREMDGAEKKEVGIAIDKLTKKLRKMKDSL
ncbi:MAG TPA: DNA primase [Clostridiales bacterium]|nr:DNA primase [Clostridiales bacterium]